jgi:hypothetical protein
VLRAERSLLSRNRLLRVRKADDHIGILRNFAADVSPMGVSMADLDCDATCRIGISRSITVITRHRD